MDGCSFVRSYHFIKKYTPGNHTTDLGNTSYEKNSFFRALPGKGGGGPCPNLSFIYIQHISSENRILKNFLIFWCTLIITLGFYLKYKPSFTFYARHNLRKLTIACIWRWWFSGAAASWNFTLVQKLHGLRSCWRQYVFVPYWGGNGCHWDGGRRVWWQGIQDGKSSHQVSYSNNILLPLCLWQCF